MQKQFNSKTILLVLTLAGVGLFGASCGKRSDLHLNASYQREGQYGANSASPMHPPFSAMRYVFHEKTVSVSFVIAQRALFCTATTPDSFKFLNGDAKKGDTVTTSWDNAKWTVLYAPGELFPVLQDAPYREEGTSIMIDWSTGHTAYFSMVPVNSATEVFTVKNSGMTLESATTPGLVLTLSMNGQ